MKKGSLKNAADHTDFIYDSDRYIRIDGWISSIEIAE
jgi:hypothetical protein